MVSNTLFLKTKSLFFVGIASLALLSASCTKRGTANIEVASTSYGLQLEIIEGNNQVSVPGRLFGKRLVVLASNLLGQPVSGLTVEFSITSGTGFYLTSSTLITDANGIAMTQVKGAEDYNMTAKIKAEIVGTPHFQVFTVRTNDQLPGVHFEIESTLGTTITAGREFGFIVKLVNADGSLVDYNGPMDTIWQIFSEPSWAGKVPRKIPMRYECVFFQGICNTPTTGTNSVVFYDSREPAVIYMGDGNSGYQDVFAYELDVVPDVPHGLVITTGTGGPDVNAPDGGAKVINDREDITTNFDPITLAAAITDIAGNYLSDAGPMTWSSDHTEISSNFSATTGETITFTPKKTIAYSPSHPSFYLEVPYGIISAQQQTNPQFADGTTGKIYVSPGTLDHFDIATLDGTLDLEAGKPYQLVVKAVDAHSNIVGKSILGSGYDGARILFLDWTDYISLPVPTGGGYPWLGPPESLIDDGTGNLIVGTQGNLFIAPSFTEQFFYGVSTKLTDNRLILFDATDVTPTLTINSQAHVQFPAVTGSHTFAIHKGPAHHVMLRQGTGGPDGSPVCEVPISQGNVVNLKLILFEPFDSMKKVTCGGPPPSFGTLDFTAGDQGGDGLFYAIEDLAGNWLDDVNGVYSTSAGVGMLNENYFRQSFASNSASSTPNLLDPVTASPALYYRGNKSGAGLIQITATYTDPVTQVTKTFTSFLRGAVAPAVYDHFEVNFIQVGRQNNTVLSKPASIWTDREFQMIIDAFDQYNNPLRDNKTTDGKVLNLQVSVPSGNTGPSPDLTQNLRLPILPTAPSTTANTPVTLGASGASSSLIYRYYGWIPNVANGPVTFDFTDPSKPSNNRSLTVTPIAGPLENIDVRTVASNPATSISNLPIIVTADESKTFFMVGKDALGNLANTPLGTWTLPNLTPDSLEYNATGASSIFNVLTPGTADKLVVTYTYDDGTTRTDKVIESGSVTLKAGKFARMSFNIPNPVIAGQEVQVEATLRDRRGNRLTHINGLQHLTIRTLGNTETLLKKDVVRPPDGDYNFVNGRVTLPFTFYNASDLNTQIQINATIEGEPGVGTSQAGEIVIQNSGLHHIHIAPTVASAYADDLDSNSTPVHIYAEDEWGNPMKSGTGSNLKVRVTLNNSALVAQDIVSSNFQNPTSVNGANDTVLEGDLVEGFRVFNVRSTTAGTMGFAAIALANGSPSGATIVDPLEILPLTTITSVQWAPAQMPLNTHNASSVSPIISAMGALAVQVLDRFGNPITTDDTAALTASIATGTQPFYGGTLNKTVVSGTATFNDLKYTKAENIVLRVALDSNPALYVEAPIQVWPNGIRQTIVIMPGQTFNEGSGLASTAITGTPFAGGVTTINAGSNFNIEVRLVDSAFNTILDNTQIASIQTYNSLNPLSPTDPNITVQQNTITVTGTTTLTNGVGTYNVTIKRQGAHQLVANPVQSSQISKLAGTSYTVLALAASKIVAILPGQSLNEGAPNITSALAGTPPAVVAGTPFNVKVIATDIWFNQIRTLSGPLVSMTTSDPRDTEPTGNQSLASGEFTFSVTNVTANTGQKITPSGGVFTASDSSLYAINAGAATQCIAVYSGQTHTNGYSSYASAVTGTPSTATACSSYTVTTRAVDAYFNTDTTYTGSVHLSTPDDPTDLSIGSSSFVLGEKIFNFTPVSKGLAHRLSMTCGTLAVNTPATHDVNWGNKAFLVPYFPAYQTFDNSSGHRTINSAISTQTLPSFLAGDTYAVNVVATDSCYNVRTDDNNVTDLTLTSTGTNFTVDGPKKLMNGVASFTSLRNFRSGTGYVVRANATASYATPKDSTTYDVLSGAPSKLLVVLPGETFDWGQATNALAASGTPSKQTSAYQYKVTVYGTDAYYNKIASDGSTVVTIAPSVGGGFTIISAPSSLVSGSATFTVESSSPLASLQVVPSVVSGISYTGENSEAFEVLSTLDTPTLSLEDSVTHNVDYIRLATTLQANITNSSTTNAWCLTTSSTRPLDGINFSNNKGPCTDNRQTGGSRDAKGWSTSAPTLNTVASGDNLKTLYLWVADGANNVSLASVSDSITLDSNAPPWPTLDFPVGYYSSTAPAGFYSNTATPTITITNDTDAHQYCLIEQAEATADPAAAPLFDNACWSSTKPSQVTLNGPSTKREVFLYTKDLAQNVSQNGQASAKKMIFYDTSAPTSFSIVGVKGDNDSVADNYFATAGGQPNASRFNPTIEWQIPSDDVSAAASITFNVEIKDGATSKCTGTIKGSNVLGLTGCNLVDGGSYTVTVTAMDQAQRQTVAGPFAFTVDDGAPAAFGPANFGITGGTDATRDDRLDNGNIARVEWDDTTGETGYRVSILNSDSSIKCPAVTTSADSISHNFNGCNLDYANIYYARVEAIDSAGNVTVGSGGNYLFTVKPQATYYHLALTIPATQTAGYPVGLTLTAKLSDGTTDTSFVGSQPVRLTTTGGSGNSSICGSNLNMDFEPSLSSPPTLISFSNGVAILPDDPGSSLPKVLLKKKESGITIKATSSIAGVSLQGTTAPFDVDASAHNCTRFMDSNLPTGNILSGTTIPLNLGSTSTIYAISFDAYGNFKGETSIEWSGSQNMAHTPSPRVGPSTTVKAVETGTGDITINGSTTPKVTFNVANPDTVTWKQTVNDADGKPIIGGPTIKKTFYYDAADDTLQVSARSWIYQSGVAVASQPSWYKEAASATRGDRAEFPARSFIVATTSGLDIIDATTNKLWMRFNSGLNFAINNALGDITDVAALEGKVYVSMAQTATNSGGLIIIDFAADKVHQITDSTKLWTQSAVAQKIQNRNGASSWTNETTTYTALPSIERVYSLSARRINNINFVAIGTESRALLLKTGSATPNLYKTTFVTNPVKVVDLSVVNGTPADFRFYYGEENVGLRRNRLVSNSVTSDLATADFTYTMATNAKLPSLKFNSLSTPKTAISSASNQLNISTPMGLTVITENFNDNTLATSVNYNYLGTGTINPSANSSFFGTGILQSLGTASSYMSAPHNATTFISNTGTIEFLFRPQLALDSLSAPMVLVAKGANTNSGSFGIDFNKIGNGKLRFWIVKSDLSIESVETNDVSTWNKGQWYHIGAVITPSVIKLYVNGVLQSGSISGYTGTFNSTTNTSSLTILGDGTTGASAAIDELRISKTDRSADASPKSPYTATAPTKYTTDPTNNVYLYLFDQTSGTSVNAENGTAGTLNGDLWMAQPLFKGSDNEILQLKADYSGGTSMVEIVTRSAWTEITGLTGTPATPAFDLLNYGKGVFFYHNDGGTSKDIGITNFNGTQDELILKVR